MVVHLEHSTQQSRVGLQPDSSPLLIKHIPIMHLTMGHLWICPSFIIELEPQKLSVGDHKVDI